MSVENIRTELQRLVRQTPFQTFIVALTGGERAIIEHPENVAFDPRPGAATDFYLLTGTLRMYSRFEKVSSISLLTTGGSLIGQPPSI